MTAQERLMAWGRAASDRTVHIWSGGSTRWNGDHLTMWAADALLEEGGVSIGVEANPLPDPEMACQMVIDRLGVAGVTVP